MMTLALALLAHPASPGPALPVPKGLVRPLPIGACKADYVAFALREMGQAVVVVEGEAPPPMDPLPTGFQAFKGLLKVAAPRVALPTDLPVAPWMDPSRIMSGPNTAGRIYPMGWGY